jgi:hypothetical protein
MFGYPFIDISPVDLFAIGSSVAFPITRMTKCAIKRTKHPHAEMYILDLLRGAAFFPFILLIVGAFSSSLLVSVVDANRVTVFLAGVIGALSVFKSDKWLMDFMRSQTPDPVPIAPAPTPISRP